MVRTLLGVNGSSTRVLPDQVSLRSRLGMAVMEKVPDEASKDSFIKTSPLHTTTSSVSLAF